MRREKYWEIFKEVVETCLVCAISFLSFTIDDAFSSYSKRFDSYPKDGRGKVISWQNWEDSSEIMMFVHAVLIRQQSGSWQIDVITIGVATMCVRGTFCDIQKVSKLRLTRYFCARNSLGPSRAQRQSCVRRGKRAEDNSAFVCLSASVERKALPPHFRLPLGNSREFCV